ncbi:MAG: glycerol kinase GlpK [Pseudomonadota bacterium]
MVDRTAILAIDQGTTSSRAIVFDAGGAILASAQEELPQIYPAEGWVEHDPEEVWRTSLESARGAIAEAEAKGVSVAALGLTNQRETAIVWERASGRPLMNAIVWQDRRTAETCRRLAADGAEPLVRERTGLVVDPYFSATKFAWIFDHVDGARARAERGELAAGTVDSWLLWKLTNGAVHATDATNASRTSLFNIHSGAWDAELLKLFNVPAGVLPEVRGSADDYGTTATGLFNRPLPILGVAGDQQAAAVGQACFHPGEAKCTFGTGCFALVHTGDVVAQSKNKLLSTVAARIGDNTTYAIEGSIFIAGAAVQWMRDGLGVIAASAETAGRAARAAADSQVVMVPAFAGMGAPHWEPGARAAVFGMSRATGPDELARAALEGVVHQTDDLLAAMAADGFPVTTLRIDGGMAANDWFSQSLADILGVAVERPPVLETTALGAARLAGLQLGVYERLDTIAAAAPERRFEPRLDEAERAGRRSRWRACVEAVLAVARS